MTDTWNYIIGSVSGMVAGFFFATGFWDWRKWSKAKRAQAEQERIASTTPTGEIG